MYRSRCDFRLHLPPRILATCRRHGHQGHLAGVLPADEHHRPRPGPVRAPGSMAERINGGASTQPAPDGMGSVMAILTAHGDTLGMADKTGAC